jgi:hypothetical protein
MSELLKIHDNGQWSLEKAVIKEPKVHEVDTSSEHTDRSLNPGLGGKYRKFQDGDPRKIKDGIHEHRDGAAAVDIVGGKPKMRTSGASRLLDPEHRKKEGLTKCNELLESLIEALEKAKRPSDKELDERAKNIKSKPLEPLKGVDSKGRKIGIKGVRDPETESTSGGISPDRFEIHGSSAKLLTKEEKGGASSHVSIDPSGHQEQHGGKTSHYSGHIHVDGEKVHVNGSDRDNTTSHKDHIVNHVAKKLGIHPDKVRDSYHAIHYAIVDGKKSFKVKASKKPGEAIEVE